MTKFKKESATYYSLLFITSLLLLGCKSSNPEIVEYGSVSATFTKTKYRCDKCNCSGYWGYKHGNGTYEGNCSNRDSGGHTCRHSPVHHGLRKW